MSNPHQAYSSPLDEGFTRPDTNEAVREDLASTVDRILTCLAAAVLLLYHTWHVTYLSHQPDPLLAQTGTTLLGKTLWEVFLSVRVCKDGKRVEVSITISPVMDAAGQSAGVFCSPHEKNMKDALYHTKSKEGVEHK